jgi:hypothetical protein
MTRQRLFSRLDVQHILELNELDAGVSYLEREGASSPDNFIIYMRENPNNRYWSDNTTHIRNTGLQIVHLHKRKLDSIEELIIKHFSVQPDSFQIKQPDTDYWGTYYNFEIFTKGAW